MTVIHAKGLVREYAPGRGVCGVSLAIEQGECVALLGRNGSGKSTLTRLLLGLERASAGRLDVFGRPVGKGSRHHLGRLGIALDTSVHWEALSGRANARFIARSYGMAGREIEARLDELFALADLGSQAHEPVATWSFGMRRKLSLVEALCHEPDLLVLDEPTTGVDAHFLVALADLIRRRSGSGKTTWIASNDPDWVAGVASRVVFLDAGRVTTEGTVAELVAEVSPLLEVRVTLAAVRPIARFELPGLRSFEQDGVKLEALVERDRAAVPRLVEQIVAQGGEVQSVEVLGTTLREAFLLKTGRSLE